MAIKSKIKTTKAKLVNKDIVKIAGIQMASGPDIKSNLDEAENLITIACNQGAKLIALPEYFSIMTSKDSEKLKAKEKPEKGLVQSFLSKQAKKNKVWIVGGSIPMESKNKKKIRNSCLIYDDKGNIAHRYDKIHLFGLDLGNEHYREDKLIEAGSDVVVVNTPFGNVGIALCYDLRFPELFRSMKDIDLLVIPSAFTATTGKAHWEILVRARAIENQCYVLAPAQGGYHLSGRETHGHSLIVDPWGTIIDQLPRGSGVITGFLNKDYIKSIRKSLPSLNHRIIK
ncbi:MAG: carbon-nitrogen hydrolase family protein [Candidatus Methylopumilus sp.]|nr:carbon-nitrogen hydrolase family protein [Candidatus Methylopumilus sp.]